jgi:hypothetical protein
VRKAVLLFHFRPMDYASGGFPGPARAVICMNRGAILKRRKTLRVGRRRHGSRGWMHRTMIVAKALAPPAPLLQCIVSGKKPKAEAVGALRLPSGGRPVRPPRGKPIPLPRGGMFAAYRSSLRNCQHRRIHRYAPIFSGMILIVQSIEKPRDAEISKKAPHFIHHRLRFARRRREQRRNSTLPPSPRRAIRRTIREPDRRPGESPRRGSPQASPEDCRFPIATRPPRRPKPTKDDNNRRPSSPVVSREKGWG